LQVKKPPKIIGAEMGYWYNTLEAFGKGTIRILPIILILDQ